MLQIFLFPIQDTVLCLAWPVLQEVCRITLAYTKCTEKWSNKNILFQKKVYFPVKGAAVYHGDNLYQLKKKKKKSMVNEPVSSQSSWSFLAHNRISVVRFHLSAWLCSPLFKQHCQSWKILQTHDNKMLLIVKVVLWIRRECKGFLTTSSQTNYQQAAPEWILLQRTSELYSTYSKHIRGLKLIERDWIWEDINRQVMKTLHKVNLSKWLWNSDTGQLLPGASSSFL